MADSTKTRPTTAMTTAAFARPPAALLASLGHQDEPGPDDGEKAEAGGGVGHRREHAVEGVKHRFLFRRGPHEDEGRAGQRQQGRPAG